MTTIALLEAELRSLALRVKELEELTKPIRKGRAMAAELPQQASDEALVAELCGFIGGTAAEIMGKSRARNIVSMRRMLVRNLRRHGWEWARIAAVFGFSEGAARKLSR